MASSRKKFSYLALHSYLIDIKLIPENKFYHITHLIDDAKNLGKKIGVFPIDETAWIDVGQWAEYRKAMDLKFSLLKEHSKAMSNFCV